MKRICREGTIPPKGLSIRYGGCFPYLWFAIIYRSNSRDHYFRVRWYMKPRLIYIKNP